MFTNWVELWWAALINARLNMPEQACHFAE